MTLRGTTFERSELAPLLCAQCGAHERFHVWICECGRVRRWQGKFPAQCCASSATLWCPLGGVRR